MLYIEIGRNYCELPVSQKTGQPTLAQETSHNLKQKSCITTNFNFTSDWRQRIMHRMSG